MLFLCSLEKISESVPGPERAGLSGFVGLLSDL